MTLWKAAPSTEEQDPCDQSLPTRAPHLCLAEVFLEATLWKPSMCSPSPHFLGVLTKRISPGTRTSVKLASAQGLAGHQGGSFDLPVSSQLLSTGYASPFFFFHMNKEEILEACLSCTDSSRSLTHFCQEGFPDIPLSETNDALGWGLCCASPPYDCCLRNLV